MHLYSPLDHVVGNWERFGMLIFLEGLGVLGSDKGTGGVGGRLSGHLVT